MATPVRYLISYDIRNPRRLVRVMRRVRKQATPVQYSVYYAQLYAAELELLISDLNGLIDSEVDDVRIYALGPLSDGIYMGSTSSPESALAMVIL